MHVRGIHLVHLYMPWHHLHRSEPGDLPDLLHQVHRDDEAERDLLDAPLVLKVSDVTPDPEL